MDMCMCIPGYMSKCVNVSKCICVCLCLLCIWIFFCHLKKYSSHNFKFLLSKSKDKNSKIFSNRRHSITEVVVPGSRIVNLFSYALSSILYNKGQYNLSVKIRDPGDNCIVWILGRVFGQAQWAWCSFVPACFCLQWYPPAQGFCES